MSLMSVSIEFKEVFTPNVHKLFINPNWTMFQFIETISQPICREFNIEEDNLEIIESGQYNLRGIVPELAPALLKTNTQLKNKWGRLLSGVAFYVRRKNITYPEVTLNTINTVVSYAELEPESETFVIEDCPVCLETMPIFCRHDCSHRICNNCHNHCLRVGHLLCPICRHN